MLSVSAFLQLLVGQKLLGAAAKNLGAQTIILGVPGYWAPVKQNTCKYR